MKRPGWTTRCSSGRCRRGAFTFVEVLATMALLAVVLPPVMEGLSLCLSTADLAKREGQASALCQSKLMELLAQGQWQEANLTGDFGEDWPGYRWDAQLSDWEDGVLQQLDLTVTWQQRGRQRTVTLTTLVNPQEELTQ